MLSVIFTLGTVNLLEIVSAQQSIGVFWALFPMALLFMISAVCECNRPPADLLVLKEIFNRARYITFYNMHVLIFF
jgi:NADH:ubiquinone oxidoreductase subunit H